MNTDKQVWIVRPLPHGKNRMQEFLQQDRIAIGYPAGTSFANKGVEDLRLALEQKGWETSLKNVTQFMLKFEIGDYVIVPDDNQQDVYIAEVTSDYIYEGQFDSKDQGYPHQRAVRWHFDKKPLARQTLPDELRSSLRFPGAIANIAKHYEIVERLISEEDTTGVTQGESVTLHEKARRVLDHLLDHEDPLVRLRAAEIVLQK
ncbi:hypothetical protein EVJ20_07535 [Exiguobacterium sp. SH0S1]|uniref:hypothetical protein n=1 Tax=Exiguobacterium sp. SH0S1 TaxID=2510949 RepID=UPI00103FAFF4|nr:hypothetical protein [Exiguobacterium sp. SH0S1]TCI77804.1 hypothetical protein EVJ20_07535 [Exiguobacterium sp. SH0S1]